jgi:hypothetical protein
LKPLTLLNIVASIVGILTGFIFLGDRFGLWSVFNNLNVPAIAFILALLADSYWGNKQGNYL